MMETTSRDIRRSAKAVYLAAPESVAKELERQLLAGADAMDRLATLERAVIVREDVEAPEWAKDWVKHNGGRCVWVSGWRVDQGGPITEKAPDLRLEIEGPVTLPIISLRENNG